MSASAQRRYYRVYRPVVVSPYWGWGGWGYNRWWNDPYYYDPAYREQVDRYNLQRDASDARKKVAKDREKYAKDGYITPKEQEKLAKDRQKYDEKVAKLNKYNRQHSY
ncbi:MAG: hypothetical protein JO314_14040 [Acidobacteria bacterium]|nr:hypothetical protein [Acidobacteriota bacterium]